MTLKRGMNLRDAIRAARRIRGVWVEKNASGEIVFWDPGQRPPRFTVSNSRKDTAWGLFQFLKKAADRAAEEPVKT